MPDVNLTFGLSTAAFGMLVGAFSQFFIAKLKQRRSLTAEGGALPVSVLCPYQTIDQCRENHKATLANDENIFARISRLEEKTSAADARYELILDGQNEIKRQLSELAKGK